MGSKRPRVEEEPVADLRRRDRQQLLVLGEVRREEDAEQDLGELDGLEREPAEVDPQACAVDGGEEQGQHEQDAGQQQQQIPVALEVA